MTFKIYDDEGNEINDYEEYFLGKDPRKTEYYKKMMKDRRWLGMIKFNRFNYTPLCSKLENWNCKTCNRKVCRYESKEMEDQEIEIVSKVI